MEVVTTNISKELSTLSKLLSGGSELKSTSCFFIDAESDKLLVTTTDLQSGMTLNVWGQVLQPGKVVVPGELSRLVTDSEVVKLKGENSDTVKVDVDESFSSTLKVLPVEEYPVFPEERFVGKISVSVQALAQILSVSESAAKEDNGTWMCGIWIGWKPTENGVKIQALGVDGINASFTAVTGKGKKGGSVIFPSSRIGALRQFLSHIPDDKKVTVGVTKKRFVVKYGDNKFWALFIDTQFPHGETMKMYKGEKSIRVEAPIQNLLRNIKLLSSILASAKTKMAKMTVTGENIILEGENSERGSGTAKIVCNPVLTKSKHAKTSVAVPMLLRLLQNLEKLDKEAVVDVALTESPTNPFLLTIKTEHGTFSSLLMPMNAAHN